MHTFKHGDWRFHHHSDLSGDVTIANGTNELAVPGSAIHAFMAEYIRRERIAALESATVDQILRRTVTA